MDFDYNQGKWILQVRRHKQEFFVLSLIVKARKNWLEGCQVKRMDAWYNKLIRL